LATDWKLNIHSIGSVKRICEATQSGKALIVLEFPFKTSAAHVHGLMKMTNQQIGFGDRLHPAAMETIVTLEATWQYSMAS